MGKSVNVTTTVPIEIHEAIKAKNWAFNELLCLGFEYRQKLGTENQKLNEILDRLTTLEETNLEWKNMALKYKREAELLKGEADVLEQILEQD